MKIKNKSIKVSSYTDKKTFEERKTFWYTALRLSDGVVFQYSSEKEDLPMGVEFDFPIEKYEKANGQIGYREEKIDLSI